MTSIIAPQIEIAPELDVTLLSTVYQKGLSYPGGDARFVYNKVPTKDSALEIALWFCPVGYIVTYAADIKNAWVSHLLSIVFDFFMTLA
jgi:hypothetical protein